MVCPLYIRELLGPGPKSAGFPDAKPPLLVSRAEISERERKGKRERERDYSLHLLFPFLF